MEEQLVSAAGGCESRVGELRAAVRAVNAAQQCALRWPSQQFDLSSKVQIEVIKSLQACLVRPEDRSSEMDKQVDSTSDMSSSPNLTSMVILITMHREVAEGNAGVSPHALDGEQGENESVRHRHRSS